MESRRDTHQGVIRFGPFTANPRTRELMRSGRRLRLTGLPFEVLLALLERPGELVPREELQQRLWPDGTFVDFDTNLNAAVRSLRMALGDSADRPRFIETLPRLGYRFLGVIENAEAEPQSIAAAVAHGLSAESPRPTSANPRRKWVIPSVLTAIVAIAGAGTWWTIGQRAVAQSERAVLVVLPFDNLSGDREQDYVSDGFTEEMITELARLNAGQLSIIARTTSFTYKGGKKSVAEIGRELRARYALEGSVRREGDRVRVTAQLIDTSDESHLWAESFDRTLSDLLSVERDVARAVASAVRLAVTTPAARAESETASVEARDAYLRARYFASQATVPAIERAIQHYRHAIATDRNYALAHAGLARAMVFATQTPPAVALQQARESAERARTLKPNLPEAELAWAMALLYRDRNLAGAGPAFQHALALDPGSAEAHFYYAQYLAASGHFDDALAEARRALALDPFSLLIHHYVGRILLFAERNAEAAEHLRRTRDLDPNYPWALMFLAVAHEQLGAFDQATALRQQYWSVMGVPPDRIQRLGTIFAASGYDGVRREWIDWIEAFAQKAGFVTSTELTLLYASLGDHDRALEWLARAVDNQTRDLIYLRHYPELKPLNGDPRFQRLLAKVFGEPGT